MFGNLNTTFEEYQKFDEMIKQLEGTSEDV
jgi:hypothetical protein